MIMRPIGKIPRVVPGSMKGIGAPDELEAAWAVAALVPSANTPLTKDASLEDNGVVIEVLF